MTFCRKALVPLALHSVKKPAFPAGFFFFQAKGGLLQARLKNPDYFFFLATGVLRFASKSRASSHFRRVFQLPLW